MPDALDDDAKKNLFDIMTFFQRCCFDTDNEKVEKAYAYICLSNSPYYLTLNGSDQNYEVRIWEFVKIEEFQPSLLEKIIV